MPKKGGRNSKRSNAQRKSRRSRRNSKRNQSRKSSRRRKVSKGRRVQNKRSTGRRVQNRNSAGRRVQNRNQVGGQQAGGQAGRQVGGFSEKITIFEGYIEKLNQNIVILKEIQSRSTLSDLEKQDITEKIRGYQAYIVFIEQCVTCMKSSKYEESWLSTIETYVTNATNETQLRKEKYGAIEKSPIDEIIEMYNETISKIDQRINDPNTPETIRKDYMTMRIKLVANRDKLVSIKQAGFKTPEEEQTEIDRMKLDLGNFDSKEEDVYKNNKNFSIKMKIQDEKAALQKKMDDAIDPKTKQKYAEILAQYDSLIGDFDNEKNPDQSKLDDFEKRLKELLLFGEKINYNKTDISNESLIKECRVRLTSTLTRYEKLLKNTKLSVVAKRCIIHDIERIQIMISELETCEQDTIFINDNEAVTAKFATVTGICDSAELMEQQMDENYLGSSGESEDLSETESTIVTSFETGDEEESSYSESVKCSFDIIHGDDDEERFSDISSEEGDFEMDNGFSDEIRKVEKELMIKEYKSMIENIDATFEGAEPDEQARMLIMRNECEENIADLQSSGSSTSGQLAILEQINEELGTSEETINMRWHLSSEKMRRLCEECKRKYEEETDPNMKEHFLNLYNQNCQLTTEIVNLGSSKADATLLEEYEKKTSKAIKKFIRKTSQDEDKFREKLSEYEKIEKNHYKKELLKLITFTNSSEENKTKHGKLLKHLTCLYEKMEEKKYMKNKNKDVQLFEEYEAFFRDNKKEVLDIYKEGNFGDVYVLDKIESMKIRIGEEKAENVKTKIKRAENYAKELRELYSNDPKVLQQIEEIMKKNNKHLEGFGEDYKASSKHEAIYKLGKAQKLAEEKIQELKILKLQAMTPEISKKQLEIQKQSVKVSVAITVLQDQNRKFWKMIKSGRGNKDELTKIIEQNNEKLAVLRKQESGEQVTTEELVTIFKYLEDNNPNFEKTLTEEMMKFEKKRINSVQSKFEKSITIYKNMLQSATDQQTIYSIEKALKEQKTKYNLFLQEREKTNFDIEKYEKQSCSSVLDAESLKIKYPSSKVKKQILINNEPQEKRVLVKYVTEMIESLDELIKNPNTSKEDKERYITIRREIMENVRVIHQPFDRTQVKSGESVFESMIRYITDQKSNFDIIRKKTNKSEVEIRNQITVEVETWNREQTNYIKEDLVEQKNLIETMLKDKNITEETRKTLTERMYEIEEHIEIIEIQIQSGTYDIQKINSAKDVRKSIFTVIQDEQVFIKEGVRPANKKKVKNSLKDIEKESLLTIIQTKISETQDESLRANLLKLQTEVETEDENKFKHRFFFSKTRNKRRQMHKERHPDEGFVDVEMKIAYESMVVQRKNLEKMMNDPECTPEQRKRLQQQYEQIIIFTEEYETNIGNPDYIFSEERMRQYQQTIQEITVFIDKETEQSSDDINNKKDKKKVPAQSSDINEVKHRLYFITNSCQEALGNMPPGEENDSRLIIENMKTFEIILQEMENDENLTEDKLEEYRIRIEKLSEERETVEKANIKWVTIRENNEKKAQLQAELNDPSISQERKQQIIRIIEIHEEEIEYYTNVVVGPRKSKGKRSAKEETDEAKFNLRILVKKCQDSLRKMPSNSPDAKVIMTNMKLYEEMLVVEIGEKPELSPKELDEHRRKMEQLSHERETIETINRKWTTISRNNKEMESLKIKLQDPHLSDEERQLINTKYIFITEEITYYENMDVKPKKDSKSYRKYPDGREEKTSFRRSIRRALDVKEDKSSGKAPANAEDFNDMKNCLITIRESFQETLGQIPAEYHGAEVETKLLHESWEQFSLLLKDMESNKSPTVEHMEGYKSRLGLLFDKRETIEKISKKWSVITETKEMIAQLKAELNDPSITSERREKIVRTIEIQEEETDYFTNFVVKPRREDEQLTPEEENENTQFDLRMLIRYYEHLSENIPDDDPDAWEMKNNTQPLKELLAEMRQKPNLSPKEMVEFKKKIDKLSEEQDTIEKINEKWTTIIEIKGKLESVRQQLEDPKLTLDERILLKKKIIAFNNEIEKNRNIEVKPKKSTKRKSVSIKDISIKKSIRKALETKDEKETKPGKKEPAPKEENREDRKRSMRSIRKKPTESSDLEEYKFQLTHVITYCQEALRNMPDEEKVDSKQITENMKIVDTILMEMNNKPDLTQKDIEEYRKKIENISQEKETIEKIRLKWVVINEKKREKETLEEQLNDESLPEEHKEKIRRRIQYCTEEIVYYQNYNATPKRTSGPKPSPKEQANDIIYKLKYIINTRDQTLNQIPEGEEEEAKLVSDFSNAFSIILKEMQDNPNPSEEELEQYRKRIERLNKERETIEKVSRKWYTINRKQQEIENIKEKLNDPSLDEIERNRITRIIEIHTEEIIYYRRMKTQPQKPEINESNVLLNEFGDYSEKIQCVIQTETNPKTIEKLKQIQTQLEEIQNNINTEDESSINRAKSEFYNIKSTNFVESVEAVQLTIKKTTKKVEELNNTLRNATGEQRKQLLIRIEQISEKSNMLRNMTPEELASPIAEERIIMAVQEIDKPIIIPERKLDEKLLIEKKKETKTRIEQIEFIIDNSNDSNETTDMQRLLNAEKQILATLESGDNRNGQISTILETPCSNTDFITIKYRIHQTESTTEKELAELRKRREKEKLTNEEENKLLYRIHVYEEKLAELDEKRKLCIIGSEYKQIDNEIETIKQDMQTKLKITDLRIRIDQTRSSVDKIAQILSYSDLSDEIRQMLTKIRDEVNQAIIDTESTDQQAKERGYKYLYKFNEQAAGNIEQMDNAISYLTKIISHMNGLRNNQDMDSETLTQLNESIEEKKRQLIIICQYNIFSDKYSQSSLEFNSIALEAKEYVDDMNRRKQQIIYIQRYEEIIKKFIDSRPKDKDFASSVQVHSLMIKGYKSKLLSGKIITKSEDIKYNEFINFMKTNEERFHAVQRDLAQEVEKARQNTKSCLHKLEEMQTLIFMIKENCPLELSKRYETDSETCQKAIDTARQYLQELEQNKLNDQTEKYILDTTRHLESTNYQDVLNSYLLSQLDRISAQLSERKLIYEQQMNLKKKLSKDLTSTNHTKHVDAIAKLIRTAKDIKETKKFQNEEYSNFIVSSTAQLSISIEDLLSVLLQWIEYALNTHKTYSKNIYEKNKMQYETEITTLNNLLNDGLKLHETVPIDSAQMIVFQQKILKCEKLFDKFRNNLETHSTNKKLEKLSQNTELLMIRFKNHLIMSARAPSEAEFGLYRQIYELRTIIHEYMTIASKNYNNTHLESYFIKEYEKLDKTVSERCTNIKAAVEELAIMNTKASSLIVLFNQYRSAIDESSHRKFLKYENIANMKNFSSIQQEQCTRFKEIMKSYSEDLETLNALINNYKNHAAENNKKISSFYAYIMSVQKSNYDPTYYSTIDNVNNLITEVREYYSSDSTAMNSTMIEEKLAEIESLVKILQSYVPLSSKMVLDRNTKVKMMREELDRMERIISRIGAKEKTLLPGNTSTEQVLQNFKTNLSIIRLKVEKWSTTNDANAVQNMQNEFRELVERFKNENLNKQYIELLNNSKDETIDAQNTQKMLSVTMYIIQNYSHNATVLAEFKRMQANLESLDFNGNDFYVKYQKYKNEYAYTLMKHFTKYTEIENSSVTSLTKRYEDLIAELNTESLKEGNESLMTLIQESLESLNNNFTILKGWIASKPQGSGHIWFLRTDYSRIEKEYRSIYSEMLTKGLCGKSRVKGAKTLLEMMQTNNLYIYGNSARKSDTSRESGNQRFTYRAAYRSDNSRIGGQTGQINVNRLGFGGNPTPQQPPAEMRMRSRFESEYNFESRDSGQQN